MEPRELTSYILLIVNIPLWVWIGYPTISVLWFILLMIFFVLNGVYGDFNILEMPTGDETIDILNHRRFWDHF